MITREQFDNLEYDIIHCDCCGRDLEKKCFPRRFVHLDGTAFRCNLCDWFHRHNDAPNIDGFTKDQVNRALEFFFFKESIYVNDLIDILNITLDEAIFF